MTGIAELHAQALDITGRIVAGIAGRGEDVGGRAFAGPVPSGQAGQLGQACGSAGVVPG